jgi:lysophospholipase L1-like esterase
VSGYGGWADRLAVMLADAEPTLVYANLAVRGKSAGAVRAEQLDAALALEPDLVTVMAGMNDLVRPGFDVVAVIGELEAMFAALTASGARVVTFTFPDIAKIAPLVRRLRPRLAPDFIERIRGGRRETRRHRRRLVTPTPSPGITRLFGAADRIHSHQ